MLKTIETPEQVNSFIESMELDTVKSCVEASYVYPSISTLNRDNKSVYVKVVKMILTKMNMLVSVKEKMLPEQINVVPALILSEYGHLRLNDINLIAQQIVTGKYKIYERIDLPFFFECVRAYDASQERIQAREDYNRRGKDKSGMHPDVAKALSKDIKKIGKGQTIYDAKLSMHRAMERLKQEKEQANEQDENVNP